MQICLINVGPIRHDPTQRDLTRRKHQIKNAIIYVKTWPNKTTRFCKIRDRSILAVRRDVTRGSTGPNLTRAQLWERLNEQRFNNNYNIY